MTAVVNFWCPKATERRAGSSVFVWREVDTVMSVAGLREFAGAKSWSAQETRSLQGDKIPVKIAAGEVVLDEDLETVSSWTSIYPNQLYQKSRIKEGPRWQAISQT